jgi:hypothetical protein
MSSPPQVRLVPATVPLLDALTDDLARFEALIGSPVPVPLGFEHVEDQEYPDLGVVWEWIWSRPPEATASHQA